MKKNTLLTQQEHSQMNELHQEYTSLEQEQTYKIVIKLQESACTCGLTTSHFPFSLAPHRSHTHITFRANSSSQRHPPQICLQASSKCIPRSNETNRQDIDNTKFIALLEKLNYSENVTFLDITLGSYCPGCSAALSRVPPPTFVAARNTIPPSKK